MVYHKKKKSSAQEGCCEFADARLPAYCDSRVSVKRVYWDVAARKFCSKTHNMTSEAQIMGLTRA